MANFGSKTVGGLVLLGVFTGCRGPAIESHVVPPQALVTEAQELASDGAFEDALAVLGQALEQNPRLTEAHLGIGDIFRGQGELQQAAIAYRDAIRSNPNNFDARYYYGLTNQLRGELEQAIASYERALRIRPDSFEANREMGAAQLQNGDPTSALPYAQRATQIDAESQAAWANLAAAYSLVGDYEGAVEAYRHTLELGEPAEPIMLGLADAHIQLGNYSRAENVLRATLRVVPSPIGYERLGFSFFKQSQFDEALSAYNEALKDEPHDLSALNGSGVCLIALYLQSDQNDEALRIGALNAWRRSLAVNLNQPMLIDLIARYSKE